MPPPRPPRFPPLLWRRSARLRGAVAAVLAPFLWVLAAVGLSLAAFPREPVPPTGTPGVHPQIWGSRPTGPVLAEVNEGGWFELTVSGPPLTAESPDWRRTWWWSEWTLIVGAFWGSPAGTGMPPDREAIGLRAGPAGLALLTLPAAGLWWAWVGWRRSERPGPAAPRPVRAALAAAVRPWVWAFAGLGAACLAGFDEPVTLSVRGGGFGEEASPTAHRRLLRVTVARTYNPPRPKGTVGPWAWGAHAAGLRVEGDLSGVAQIADHGAEFHGWPNRTRTTTWLSLWWPAAGLAGWSLAAGIVTLRRVRRSRERERE